MGKYLMAIDAGTGSVRSVIFDLKGQQVAMAQQEWHHLEEDGVASSMTFDYSSNWNLVVACIKKSLTESGLQGTDIAAVSATSMREGILAYDAKGDAVWGVANVDARASQEVAYLKSTFPNVEEEFYQQSGQTFALGALPRLLWLKRHRKNIYDKVAKISMISDWVLARLSGVIATDPSNAGTTGIFDLKTRNWLPEMAEKIGIKESIFPEVLESGTVMGKVRSKVACETGLSTDTLVVMGGGDVQLGAAGLGVVRTSQVAILGGSFWQQVVNIDAQTPPPADMGIRVNPHVIKGQSQAEGITFFSGLIMRWFRDVFCSEEVRRAQEEGVDAYALLEEQASMVPIGSHGILPIFSDSMKYGKWQHAAPSFVNLSIDSTMCNKGSLFRSLQENACIVSAINLNKIKHFTGIEFDEIVFAGGASKGFLWPQILADVCGCTVKIPKVTEATALGVAITAGVGAGIYSSIENAAESLVSWDRFFHPNHENFKQYIEIRQQWQKVYEKQMQLVDEGLTKSMWKAPGIL